MRLVAALHGGRQFPGRHRMRAQPALCLEGQDRVHVRIVEAALQVE
jgi:hypothetical protein